MGERSGLDLIIFLCAILAWHLSYYLGFVVIPLELDTELILVLIIAGLACIALIGWLERKRRMDEVAADKFSRVNSSIFIGAITIIIVILLTLAGIHPPGMDPEVPFLFVIPFFAALIALAVSIEEIALWLKLDQPK